MSYLQIVLLSIGLAMDAMAVAAARGFAVSEVKPGQVFQLAVLFGLAQAVMPALGWTIGRELGGFMAALDHWFAFFVLGALGVKMLRDARDAAPAREPTVGGLRTLIALALATSIDAFAVGLTLPLLQAPFLLSIATIGVVTALLSALGVTLGRRFGRLLGPRLDAFGGVVLILLGCKILIEHLSE